MKIFGRATVKGLPNTVTHGNMPADAAWLPARLDVTHDADTKVELIDPATGEILGFGIARENFAATVSVYLVGDDATKTLANAQGALTPLAAVDTVTFAASESPETGLRDYDGVYLYTGGATHRYDPSGYVVLDLPCKKYISTEAGTHTTIATAKT